MGNIGLPGILLIALLVLLLFGGNRFSSMMGDVAKGFKNFKKGMSDEDEPAKPAPKQLPREDDVIDGEVTRDRDQSAN